MNEKNYRRIEMAEEREFEWIARNALEESLNAEMGRDEGHGDQGKEGKEIKEWKRK